MKNNRGILKIEDLAVDDMDNNTKYYLKSCNRYFDCFVVSELNFRKYCNPVLCTTDDYLDSKTNKDDGKEEDIKGYVELV